MPLEKATSRLRIIFWSSSEFGLPTLSFLLKSGMYDVPLVITRAPAPKGRKHELAPTVVGTYMRAEYPDVPLAEPEKLAYNEELKARVRALNPDAYVLASFGMILPQSFLALVKHPLCLHPGPLPKLRGPIPIRAALMEGLTETELCVMKMVREADAGPVMLRRKQAIDPQDNFRTLREKLARLGAQCTYVALRSIMEGSEHYEDQIGEPSYTKMLTTEGAYIDFGWDARRIVNFIRGMALEPGAACLDPWGHRIKLLSATMCKQAIPGASPGAVLSENKASFVLAAGDDNAICVHEVQPEGRRLMSAHEYLAGHHICAGLSFSNIPLKNEQED